MFGLALKFICIGPKQSGIPFVSGDLHPAHMTPIKKEHLPEKNCATCGLPFRWRKKWERCWDEVKYCSDRCRQHKNTSDTTKTKTLPTHVQQNIGAKRS